MLFGHQNDDTNQPADSQTAPQDVPALAPPPSPDEPADSTGVNPLAVDPATGASLPAVPAEEPAETEPASAPAEEPAASIPAAPEVSEPPAVLAPTEEVAPDKEESSGSVAAPASDDLLSMKQQALSQLSPLVSQLDQTPEEKFRTTMMLIQSTDNQSLLKEAYDAAQAITDEKVRAQALLDVVNEINYFTQQKPAS